MIDQDVIDMESFELRAEVEKLREAIRKHRDASGHNLCWLNNRELYDALPEKKQTIPMIPPWPEFMTNCARYREMLDDLDEAEADENFTVSESKRVGGDEIMKRVSTSLDQGIEMVMDLCAPSHLGQ